MAQVLKALASSASLSSMRRGTAAQTVEVLINMMGEGFVVPNVALALQTHRSDLNRSVTESHMLPRSSRKLRMCLYSTGGIT